MHDIVFLFKHSESWANAWSQLWHFILRPSPLGRSPLGGHYLCCLSVCLLINWHLNKEYVVRSWAVLWHLSLYTDGNTRHEFPQDIYMLCECKKIPQPMNWITEDDHQKKGANSPRKMVKIDEKVAKSEYTVKPPKKFRYQLKLLAESMID